MDVGLSLVVSESPRTAQRSEHFHGGRGGAHVAVCQQEYDYYDRIPDMAPNRIEPIDVMMTIAMNSFVNNATMVRLVHRGLAGQCDSILHLIPADADLLTFDPQLREFEKLIHAAVQARQVLVPVATGPPLMAGACHVRQPFRTVRIVGSSSIRWCSQTCCK